MEQVTDKELLTIIKEMFLSYNERKKTNSLYHYNPEFPKLLIKLYYDLDEKNRALDELTANFMQHYIDCECVLENTHEPFEKQGLKAMYDYVHSEQINEDFSIYTLLDLHTKLFSSAPHPEAGGHFRNDNVYLPTTGINLSDWRSIWSEIKQLDSEVKEIGELGKKVKDNVSNIFEYIERCIILKCKLIKIHPFWDGNGRVVRGFINRLFLNVGLPSVYISENENRQYRMAMQRAIGDENDYSSIIQFYYYKICDSIFELDIYPIINEEKFNLPKQVIEMAKEYAGSNHAINKETNKQICDEICTKLKELSVQHTLYSTSQFDEDVFPHDFIVVYYKTLDNNRLVIDPMFATLEKEGYIEKNDEDPILNNVTENLRTNGIAAMSNIELSEYINLFKTFDKSLAICKASPRQIVLYKKY